jgi:hypothetical protein
MTSPNLEHSLLIPNYRPGAQSTNHWSNTTHHHHLSLSNQYPFATGLNSISSALVSPTKGLSYTASNFNNRTSPSLFFTSHRFTSTTSVWPSLVTNGYSSIQPTNSTTSHSLAPTTVGINSTRSNWHVTSTHLHNTTSHPTFTRVSSSTSFQSYNSTPFTSSVPVVPGIPFQRHNSTANSSSPTLNSSISTAWYVSSTSTSSTGLNSGSSISSRNSTAPLSSAPVTQSSEIHDLTATSSRTKLSFTTSAIRFNSTHTTSNTRLSFGTFHSLNSTKSGPSNNLGGPFAYGTVSSTTSFFSVSPTTTFLSKVNGTNTVIAVESGVCNSAAPSGGRYSWAIDHGTTSFFCGISPTKSYDSTVYETATLTVLGS